MKTTLRFVLILMLILLVSVSSASALPVTMHDYDEPFSFLSFMQEVKGGGSYYLSFTLSLETNFSPDSNLIPPAAENHDLFSFGVADLANNILWVHEQDVTGSIPILNFRELVVTPLESDQSLSAYFYMENIRTDYDVTVTIDNVMLEMRDVAPVPEPSSVLLFTAGLAGIFVYRRKK